MQLPQLPTSRGQEDEPGSKTVKAKPWKDMAARACWAEKWDKNINSDILHEEHDLGIQWTTCPKLREDP